MSSQDKLEQILREIHIMIAEAMPADPMTNDIIIDKKEIYERLNRLNVAIYEIMDEYELTQQSRDRAERDARKHGDDIVQQADHRAEDVYAASMLYTNDALTRMQYIMQDAIDHFELACNEAKERLMEEKRTVRSNQSELKGQLQDLKDTEKYMHLIEEANKRIDKEREEEQLGRRASRSPYADIKPEIKVNPAYFERIGVELDEDGNPILPGEEDGEEKSERNTAKFRYGRGEDLPPLDEDYESDFELIDISEKKSVEPDVKVNLDSAYFKQKGRRTS